MVVMVVRRSGCVVMTAAGEVLCPDYCCDRHRPYYPQVPISTRDLVLFPIHIHGNHWTLAVLDIKKWQIGYYDSNQGGPGLVLHHLRQWVSDELICESSPDKRYCLNSLHPGALCSGDQWYDVSTGKPLGAMPPCPRQANGHDCGLFLVMIIEALSNNLPLQSISQKDMRYWRQRCAADLLHGNLEYRRCDGEGKNGGGKGGDSSGNDSSGDDGGGNTSGGNGRKAALGVGGCGGSCRSGGAGGGRDGSGGDGKGSGAVGGGGCGSSSAFAAAANEPPIMHYSGIEPFQFSSQRPRILFVPRIKNGDRRQVALQAAANALLQEYDVLVQRHVPEELLAWQKQLHSTIEDEYDFHEVAHEGGVERRKAMLLAILQHDKASDQPKETSARHPAPALALLTGALRSID